MWWIIFHDCFLKAKMLDIATQHKKAKLSFVDNTFEKALRRNAMPRFFWKAEYFLEKALRSFANQEKFEKLHILSKRT